MTTDKRQPPRPQSTNHRIVRVMAVAVLVIMAIAFALYGFAAWSGSVINCAPDALVADACRGATRAMWVFAALTLAALAGAVVAWRKLDA